VLNLLAAGELRLMCERLGIAQLDRKRTQVELPNPNGNRKQPLKQFVEMLHIRFAAEAADSSQQQMGGDHVDPATIMRLVARNAKRGAQFTPQGVLRWPVTSAKAADVLSETRALLESLSGAS
jgi:transcription-repair coupling factor (superfamily II helicase)